MATYSVCLEGDHRGSHLYLYPYDEDEKGKRTYSYKPDYGHILTNDIVVANNPETKYQVYLYTGKSYKPILLHSETNRLDDNKVLKQYSDLLSLCEQVYIHFHEFEPIEITGLSSSYKQKIGTVEPAKAFLSDEILSKISNIRLFREMEEPAFLFISNGKGIILHVLPLLPEYSFITIYDKDKTNNK
jgi:hypothetical protein